jgi:signal transduction histidine kinase
MVPRAAGEGYEERASATERAERDVRAALARIRRALLDQPLDEGLAATAQILADTCGPAHCEVWLADQSAWVGELSRTGGRELFPAVRLRAGADTTRAHSDPDAAGSYPALRLADLVVEEVVSARRPLILLDAGDSPVAQAWMAVAAPRLETIKALMAVPLEVRGQFLGVLVVGTGEAAGQARLALIEGAADHCALAADHDRLVSYSRGQEALAQTVVRQAPVAVAVLTGPDHVFSLANPAFAQLLGVESGLRGRRLEEVIPGVDRLSDSFRLDAVYRTGEPQAMIELPIHLDRGLTYWNVTSSPLPGSSARVGGVLVAAIDVTRQVIERQRALEAAEVAQERIGQMMALHATSLAVSSQLGADPRELLADILRRSIALLGARAGTVYVADHRTGELEVIVCHGLRGDYVGSRIRLGDGLAGQVARSGEGLLVDDIRLYPTSAAIYAGEAISAVIAVPLIHHNRVVGVLDVLDDADRRTFTQAAQAIENARTYVELERAYQAQREMDRLKDDFIATASHELRTPLTGVQGFLDLLLDYNGSRDEPLAREFLERAAGSAAELTELTERLLETSNLDTGRVEIRREPIHLRTLVDDVLRARAAAEARAPGAPDAVAHALEADVPDGVVVWADPARLKEVLDNLVGNAIKYSPRGGAVRVRCAIEAAPAGHAAQARSAPPLSEPPRQALAEAGAAEAFAAERPAANRSADGNTPAYAVITISDQGIGIAPAERDRLFGRFARLDGARTSQIRGTGLGLYICRQLMQAMGGSIWLHESAPGRGSTFAAALPLVSSAEATDTIP